MKNILIYTVHKAASMFLHQLTIDAAHEFGIDYYSINNSRYFDEIKQSSWKIFIENKLKENQSQQSCFGPIRSGITDAIFPEALSEYSVILHLRDPRDVLTSFFFYHTYSHLKRKKGFNPDTAPKKPWQDGEIDDFVLAQLPSFKARYHLLISILLGNDNVKFMKYEDMVSNYSAWLDRFLSAFSYLDVSSKQTPKPSAEANFTAKIHQKLFEKYKDEFVIPIEENIYRHKRVIKPGDHRNKLQPNTIEILDSEFSSILTSLSYT